MLKWVTAGESHGKALLGVIEGVPAGLELPTADLRRALAQRRLGYGRGARQKFEQDEVEVLSGLRHGRTLGSPVAIQIANTEWPKWTAVMSPDAVDPELLKVNAGTGDEREVARNLALTKPRPGHADFAGMLKYGHRDARNVLERSSARETAARVALGCVAQAILSQVAQVELVSHVISIGAVSASLNAPKPQAQDVPYLDQDPVRCFDPEASARMVAAIDEAKSQGDTLGGVVEVLAYGVPLGLGSYVGHDSRLDSRLAAALMSIQAVKGVEIGEGFLQATLPGSQSHDPLSRSVTGRGQVGEVYREKNLAGGIEGGMSNGSTLVLRAAVKPISTVPRSLPTVDLATGENTTALHQRSDTSAVVPAAVIAQAEVALVLAQALLEKTGGDSLAEARRNLAAYLQEVTERTSWS